MNMELLIWGIIILGFAGYGIWNLFKDIWTRIKLRCPK